MIEARPSLAAALTGLAGAVALAACSDSTAPNDDAPTEASPAPAAETATMELTSTAFTANQSIPSEFTCDGEDRSPPLEWSDPPEGTQSFALVVEDPDAPGGTFRHWGVHDIPADARQLAAGAASGESAGFAQTENDFGEAGYNGPCPPEGRGAHHYVFRLFALDVAKLPGSPSKVKDVLDAVDGHVLAGGRLTASYARD